MKNKEQIFPTFKLFAHLIKKLSPEQITWKFHHQLKGLQRCLEHGENLDLVPNPSLHQHEKYYEWYYWRHFTQKIHETYIDSQENSEIFHSCAMLMFVRVCNQYLKYLQVI